MDKRKTDKLKIERDMLIRQLKRNIATNKRLKRASKGSAKRQDEIFKDAYTSLGLQKAFLDAIQGCELSRFEETTRKWMKVMRKHASN